MTSNRILSSVRLLRGRWVGKWGNFWLHAKIAGPAPLAAAASGWFPGLLQRVESLHYLQNTGGAARARTAAAAVHSLERMHCIANAARACTAAAAVHCLECLYYRVVSERANGYWPCRWPVIEKLLARESLR